VVAVPTDAPDGILILTIYSIWLLAKLRQRTNAALKMDLKILKLMKDIHFRLQNEICDLF
jgi:hypothetical protein